MLHLTDKPQADQADQLAETPANACRIPIFAPTRRPEAIQSWRVETSWGYATITGKLGQQHRDLLDAAHMVAEDWGFSGDDDRLRLLVDPAKLRTVLGGGDKDKINHRLMKSWIIDLMQSIVEIHVKNPDIKIMGGLISDLKDSVREAPTRAGAIGAGRRYWLITFGTAWSKLVEDDHKTRYPVQQVAALKHGFSQAVARYALSHASTNDTISGLAEKLAATGRIRNLRGNLNDDAERLAEMGILISGDKVTRRPPPKPR